MSLLTASGSYCGFRAKKRRPHPSPSSSTGRRASRNNAPPRLINSSIRISLGSCSSGLPRMLLRGRTAPFAGRPEGFSGLAQGEKPRVAPTRSGRPELQQNHRHRSAFSSTATDLEKDRRCVGRAAGTATWRETRISCRRRCSRRRRTVFCGGGRRRRAARKNWAFWVSPSV